MKMNVNEEILQNGEEENQNENGSSKEKKNAKKVTKKQPAKANQYQNGGTEEGSFFCGTNDAF